MNTTVSIIIIHYGETDFLKTCLTSIKNSTYKYYEIIVVDNNPQPISEKLPLSIDNYIYSGVNHGFAEACNIGVRQSGGEFVFILNNDIELNDRCIEKLVSIGLSDNNIAVLQPKMLDMDENNLFHSSAAGGMLDIFGYPFARGRIVDNAEIDRGQYDDPIEIFWCSGAALFARKNVLEKAGLFDKDFFLYMEEIDLQWRIHLLGYKIVYIPDAVIYHKGSPTFDRQNISRMYYVHRNSLIMLLKNLPSNYLNFIIPLRLLIELSSIVFGVLTLNLKRPIAVIKAFGYILNNFSVIKKKRAVVQNLIKVPFKEAYDKMYHGSIVLQYFLFKKRNFFDYNVLVKPFNHNFLKKEFNNEN